jgi:hypothetical protein
MARINKENMKGKAPPATAAASLKGKAPPAGTIIRHVKPVSGCVVDNDPDEVVLPNETVKQKIPRKIIPKVTPTKLPACLDGNVESATKKKEMLSTKTQNHTEVTPEKVNEANAVAKLPVEKNPSTPEKNIRSQIDNPYKKKDKSDMNSVKITMLAGTKLAAVILPPTIKGKPNVGTKADVVTVKNNFGIATKNKLGITSVSRPTTDGKPKPKPINYTFATKLRCAYIEGVDDCTAVFWFEQLGQKSYWTQNRLRELITKGQTEWLINQIPFDSPDDDPTILYLYLKNEYQRGFGASDYGLRLFHYTTALPGQSADELLATANCIAANINAINNCYQVLVDENHFLMYDMVPCVWINLLKEEICLLKLKRETQSEFNDSGSNNVYFWEDHKNIIGKYFWSDQLTPDLSLKFNSPLRTIIPHFITKDLVDSVNFRRSHVLKRDENPAIISEIKRDPRKENNYSIAMLDVPSDNTDEFQFVCDLTAEYDKDAEELIDDYNNHNESVLANLMDEPANKKRSMEENEKEGEEEE